MASTSAASVLGPYVTARVADLERLAPVARTGDADAIHDMRVSSRRLKSVLAAYQSTFDPATGRQMRAELDWLAETLGHARDHEVQRIVLLGVTSADGALEIDSAHDAMAAEAQTVLSAALISARYRVLSEELGTFATTPPWTSTANGSATNVLLPSLRKQFARVESRVRSARKASARAKVDYRLHQVRKSVKRARYATEALEPILPTLAADIAKQLSLFQDVLGAHNDLVVTRGNLTRWRDLGVSALEGVALDELDARARTSRQEARRSLITLSHLVAETPSELDVTLRPLRTSER